MRPTVEELHHSGRYVLIESFAIDEMNQFVLRELGMKPPSTDRFRKRDWKEWLGLIGIGAVSGLLGYFITYSLISGFGKGADSHYLGQAGIGVVAFFLVLPIHEFIHGLAFRYVGATKVGYGWSLKSLMVYAYSQLFPATMREVALVAAMPFIVITIVASIGLVLWPAYTVSFVTFLLIHTAGCMGDFALIRYYVKNRHQTIYTYDDVEGERRSYFFAERL